MSSVTNGMLYYMLPIVSGNVTDEFHPSSIPRTGGARVVLSFLYYTHWVEYRLQVASLQGRRPYAGTSVGCRLEYAKSFRIRGLEHVA